MRGRVRGLLYGAAVLVSLCLAYAGVRAWQFRDRFVMVTVEESSSSAVTSWPLLAERLPGVFLDCASQVVSMRSRPFLLGVSLGLYYSATSQGIEIADSIRLSRTGKAAVELDRPLSFMTDSLDGERIELVDNRARVVAGNLSVEGTSPAGTVRFRYGERRFSLAPGESWAELLVLTPDGPKAVDPRAWEDEFRLYMEKGYPATRIAIANRGFWPKSGVKAGMEP